MFSAAHFITLADGSCEPLHGHDFRVGADVEGPLDATQCVVDFVALEKLLRRILDEFEHRVILPTEHPAIRVAQQQGEIEVRFEDRRWVFPAAECVLLPVANTTAERIAEQIGRRLLADVRESLGVQPASAELRLQESPGYAAVWRWRRRAKGAERKDGMEECWSGE